LNGCRKTKHVISGDLSAQSAQRAVQKAKQLCCPEPSGLSFKGQLKAIGHWHRARGQEPEQAICCIPMKRCSTCACNVYGKLGRIHRDTRTLTRAVVQNACGCRASQTDTCRGQQRQLWFWAQHITTPIWRRCHTLIASRWKGIAVYEPDLQDSEPGILQRIGPLFGSFSLSDAGRVSSAYVLLLFFFLSNGLAVQNAHVIPFCHAYGVVHDVHGFEAC